MVGLDFSEREVVEAWKEYLDILNTTEPEDETQRRQFYERRNDKFFDLIYEISKAVGYRLARLEVKKQWYTPVAHGTWAEQETILREGVTKLFKNEGALPIRIIGEPPNTP